MLLVTGCSTTSDRLLTWDGGRLANRELNDILLQNPLAPDQNVRLTLLGQTERTSAHVVQVRMAEVPHAHQTHDLSVFVVRGNGVMVVGSETVAVRAGDVVFVPAGVRHCFINQDRSPSVAVVVFSPPYDGTDTVRTE